MLSEVNTKIAATRSVASVARLALMTDAMCVGSMKRLFDEWTVSSSTRHSDVETIVPKVSENHNILWVVA